MEKATEDYVSYEVAKLLKEKGFDWKCLAHWFIGIDRNFSISATPQNWNEVKTDLDWLSCPTHQMAMRWLRKVHNLCIAPYAAAYRYGFTIDKCDTGSNICNDDVINEELTTYEEAVEAALKYCLTELI